jgi:ornithine cyclodeaminase
MTIAFYDAAEVEERLDYPGCIDAMRRAMTALSSGERPQPLRQIFTVGEGEMFGTMLGELAALSVFGAKLVSVFGDPGRAGRSRHQGVVVATTERPARSAASPTPSRSPKSGPAARALRRVMRSPAPMPRSSRSSGRASRRRRIFARCRWCGRSAKSSYGVARRRRPPSSRGK